MFSIQRDFSTLQMQEQATYIRISNMAAIFIRQ